MSGIEPVGKSRPDASMDIIFVHGLGGHWKTTWEFPSQPAGKPNLKSDTPSRAQNRPNIEFEPSALFWPEWIAEALPRAAVWALNYDANLSDWSRGMALSQHGDQALAMLVADGFGRRPIVFVAHSLGGLVVKSLLQASYDDLNPINRAIAHAACGVIFFATPNSGSTLASRITRLVGMLGPIGQLARLSALVRVLRANEPELLRLNRWYRDRVTDATGRGLKISTQVFYETRPILLGLISVVDASSADPGIGGSDFIPVSEDHFGICKLSNVEHWIFKRVVQFVSGCTQTDAQGDGPIIELVVPSSANSIRLVVDANMIPNGNVTFHITRSDGAKK